MVVFKSSPDGDLPRNNGALFRRLAMALWERERTRQTPGWIPFEQMEASFGKLAFAMIDEDMPIDVPREYALRHLGDESLLQAGASANFIEVRGDEVRFYHQLIQEYYAAIQLTNTNLGKIIDSTLLFSIVGEIAEIPAKWDQVIIALCGLVPDPEQPISRLLSINCFLAVECIASGIDISLNLYQEIVDTLVRIFQQSDLQSMREAAVKGLVEVGHADILEVLVEASHDEDTEMQYIAIDGLGNLGSVAFEALVNILSGPDWMASVHVAEVLERVGTPQAINVAIDFWKEQLKDPTDIYINYRASSALERIGTSEALAVATRFWVKALSNTGQDDSSEKLICETAAEALERIGTPEALEAVRRWREEQKKSSE